MDSQFGSSWLCTRKSRSQPLDAGMTCWACSRAYPLAALWLVPGGWRLANSPTETRSSIDFAAALNLMRSPVLTSASGPPAAASGLTCRMTSPKGCATHAGIRNADHVLDTLCGQLLGDRKIAGFRHGCCTPRPPRSAKRECHWPPHQARDHRSWQPDLREMKIHRPAFMFHQGGGCWLHASVQHHRVRGSLAER